MLYLFRVLILAMHHSCKLVIVIQEDRSIMAGNSALRFLCPGYNILSVHQATFWRLLLDS